VAKTIPLSDPEGNHVGELLECPACGYGHLFRTVPGRHGEPVWTFNGDRDKPTFSPSMLVNAGLKEKYPDVIVCHSFVRDGRIEFLSDCSHAMAGQSVELLEVE
jgi:hypothetical protein